MVIVLSTDHLDTKKLKGEKQIQKKRDWGTKGGYIAPIIVPATPNSELEKSLRELTKFNLNLLW